MFEAKLKKLMQKLDAVILLEEGWFQAICSCSFIIFSAQNCCFHLLVGYVHIQFTSIYRVLVGKENV